MYKRQLLCHSPCQFEAGSETDQRGFLAQKNQRVHQLQKFALLGFVHLFPELGVELIDFFAQLCAVWSVEEAVVQGFHVVVHGMLSSRTHNTENEWE